MSINHVTGRTGIAALLPEDVEVDERTSDIPLDTLMPQEYAAIARAVPTRRAEFATVRCCARQALSRLAAMYPTIHWGPVLFSARESIYKTWYRLTHAWLDFTDCELVIDSEHGTYTGHLLVPGPRIDGTAIAGFDGRWSVMGRQVLTAVRQPR